MKTPDFTQLTKNPLGVIGLFIWLIYSIAGLVFATSISSLEFCIQLIFTIFIVTFPFVILAVFYILVTKHHNKLYAPSDFKDETLFFRPATEEEVQENKEVIFTEEFSPQQKQTETPTSSFGINYQAIEKSALNIVERSYGRNIPRDFVTELDGKKFFFDGVYQDDKKLDLFEVKVYRRPAFKREFIEAIMYRATSLLLNDGVNNRNRDFCLWLVIVTDFEGDALENFKKKMQESVDTNNFEVKWQFISLEEIKKNT